MTRINARIVWMGLVSLLLLVAAAGAQDFQKDYRLAANARIRISNVSGDLNVTGYEGETILVKAFKEGRDRNLVEVEDSSTQDRLELRVRYPENCNCSASVRFEVVVPRKESYTFERLSSVSGDISLRGISGRVRAESVSGDVLVEEVNGIVSASTVSGDLDVQIARLEGSEDMKFSSVSGDVRVRVPANLDAEIEMSSLSGSLKTDFPIEIKERRYGPGRSASARVGSGARSLKVSTVSGRISLERN